MTNSNLTAVQQASTDACVASPYCCTNAYRSNSVNTDDEQAKNRKILR